MRKEIQSRKNSFIIEYEQYWNGYEEAFLDGEARVGDGLSRGLAILRNAEIRVAGVLAGSFDFVGTNAAGLHLSCRRPELTIPDRAADTAVGACRVHRRLRRRAMPTYDPIVEATCPI